MKQVRCVPAAMLFATAIIAQAPAAQQPERRAKEIWEQLKYQPLSPLRLPDVEEFQLSNGMRVLLLENHELPLVRGTALVRTGNLFDPADKVGLASVTGSVLRSGGTKTKTGDQLDEELENIAAVVESGIGETSGSVSFSCLKDNTDEVLGVFRDVVTSPEFRQSKIDLIKGQMASGISRRNDDPGEIAQREFTSILYGRNNSYGWNEEYSTLAHIQRPDVVAFYQRYFFPANIILAVQGDFSTPAMKSKLESLFGSWAVGQPAVPPFPAVHFDSKPGVYLADKDDVTQTTFILGQPGGELRNPDFPALEVMSDILGGGFNSRLFKRIRTQLGYVYGVNANWGANYDHPGLFSINGSTKSSSTVQAIEACRKEVDRIRTELVTEAELVSARETVLNSFVFFFDTPGKTLNRILTYYYFGYPKDFIFQYQKAVEAVTREDVLRVAKKYLDPSQFVTVTVGNPKDFGTPLTQLDKKVTTIDLTIPPPGAETAGTGSGSSENPE